MAALLEATRPPLVRDSVKLMVSQGSRIEHARFTQLADYLEPGDLLVVNDSRTLPSALETPQGRLHVSTELAPARWVVEPRGTSARSFVTGGNIIRLLAPYGSSQRIFLAETDVPDRSEFLLRHGRPIRYSYVTEEFPLSAYQTLFGRVYGSAEMPSAARPFTPRVVRSLLSRGVELARLTLHTGVASLENDERPYPEFFEIPERTLRKLDRARRVIAVGTTVARALHSEGTRGWTDRVVRPGDSLRVDGLLTGLHEPRSTHLWMLQALCGNVDRYYAEASERGYRWHEFGDVHLLLSP
jgi:S-adenosylmethionine:tRNA ribosyltransferase-isomerase